MLKILNFFKVSCLYNRVAQHMGTSVLMIEQHYGHVLLRKKAHQIAGGNNLYKLKV